MNNVVGDWFDVMNGLLSEEEYNRRYPTTLTPATTVVKVGFDIYGDVIEYADGHTEYRSIGD